MRDLIQNPMEVREIVAAVKRQRGIGNEDHDLAMGFLMHFLESPGVQEQLTEFLEQVQPKAANNSLETLDQYSCECLLHRAHGNFYPYHVHHATYVGRSLAGSYMYDLNPAHGKVRLYVRIVQAELRGEVYEDNFQLPLTPARRASDEETNDKVSVLGRWFHQMGIK